MTAIQFVGYTMINTTSISSITTANRITSGMRPASSAASALPAINYYKISGGRYGIKNITVTINCRAITEIASENLQSLVLDTFVGSDGLGKYADVTGFSAYRISLVKEHQTMIESDSTPVVYNSPVDISIIY